MLGYLSALNGPKLGTGVYGINFKFGVEVASNLIEVKA